MALRRSARARQPRLLPDFVSPDDIFGGHARDTKVSKVKITKSYHDDLSNIDSTLCNSLAISTTDSETENKDPTPLNLCNTDKSVAREDLLFKSWIEKTKEYDDATILDDESLQKDTIDICNDSVTLDRFDNTLCTAFKTVPSVSGTTVLSEEGDNSSTEDANVSSRKKSKIAKRKVYTYKEKMPSLKTFLNPKRIKENTNFAEDSSIDPTIKLSSSKTKAEYSSFEAWPKRDTLSTNSRETTTQQRRGINSGVSDVETENDNQHDISSSNEDNLSEQQTSSSLVYETDKEPENEESTLDVILDCESDDDNEDIYNQFEDDDTIDSNSSPPYLIPFDPDKGAISNCDNQIPAPIRKAQRVLKCPYCQYLAMKSSHLKRHVRKHTGERPFQCPHCRYSAMRKEHLHRHFGFKHKELLRVACQECRYRTTDEQSLNVHLKLTHPEIFNQVYKCGQCEFESARKSQYVEHAKLHRMWECPICRYSTGDWTTYRRHKRSHTEERPYTCHMCTYTAKLKVDLERHIRAHTGERPFTCPQCSYRGARKDSLVRHMRTHTGDKPYKCPLCEFASAQQGHLVTHIRTHTGERPFTCPCCEYACCDRSSLVKHVRIHTGERPYKCPHCPFAAIRNQDLKDHINIHTGQRPYMCSQCSYAAADRSTLRTHAKKHSQKSRFSCQQCEFSCACKATLVKHLKKHKGTRPFKEEIKEEKDVPTYRIPGQVKEKMADDTY